MWGSSTGHSQNRSRGHHGGNHTQTQSQAQKMIVDQNYANNIVFMALSALEQIHMKNEGIQNKKKKFGYYDKVNYDYKDLSELKSQLQVNLMLLKASKECFAQEYGQMAYKLPSQYNQGHVVGQVQKFKNYFQQKQQEDFYWLCNDFLKLMNNNFNDLYFEKKNFTVQYDDSQKKKHQKELFKQGLDAADEMDKEKKKIQDLGPNITPETLPTNIGKEEIFSHTSGSSSEMVNQEDENKTRMTNGSKIKVQKKVVLENWQQKQVDEWEMQKKQRQNWMKQYEEDYKKRRLSEREYQQKLQYVKKWKQEEESNEIQLSKWKCQSLQKRQKQIKAWMDQAQPELLEEKKNERFASSVTERAHYKKIIQKRQENIRLAKQQSEEIDKELFHLKQGLEKTERHEYVI